MKKRWLASFLSLCLLVALLPTAAMAVDEVEDPKVFTISDFIEAQADGTYDNSQDENYETNAQHVTYTYDENKTCSYNKKDDEGNYIEGNPYWVKTVTFKGITFNNLVVGSDEIKTLQSVIMNGRRTDTSNQFQASIEVKFENCTFNQTSGTLQVYQIMPCNVTKYSFDECSFNQNATSQYAITLNASETAYKTHISYEITNSHISSKGRGINITAGTEQETLNEVNGTPHIIISNNAFELPKSSDSNMAVQIAGNWSAANLDSTEDALITISDNTIDAYTAVRIHDSMGKNTGDSAKYLVSFSNNTLLNSTQAIVAKTGTNSDENAMLEAIRDAYQSAEDGFITPATSVNLNTTTLSLYSNTEPNTATLTATVLPENTTDEVVWTSSNTNVATVSKAGLVTAVADGTAIITATAGTRESAPSASCTVTVTTYYSGGSSSDDDSDPTYSVTLPKNVKGGEVKTSHRYAEQGNTVTITVDPDKGYELDELTVTDSKGKELDLTDKGNGKYTFKMPGTRVEVEVSFKLIETEPESPVFADVSASAYYADAVKWAVEQGITSGTSATTFSPDMSCTRAQIVTFLWRANGSPKADGANPFTDVSADAYYYDAVLWAVKEGITSGTSDTTFSPNVSCTRAQMVTFLWRAAGSPQPTSGASPFTDVTDTNAYYYNAVLWAAEQGITGGVSATTFGVNSPVAYDQILAFLARTAGDTAAGSDWSAAAVNWAAANGLTDGLDFGAKDSCPRSDVIYCLWKQLA